MRFFSDVIFPFQLYNMYRVLKLLHLSNNSFRSNRFNLGSRNYTVWSKVDNLGKTHKSILLQETFFLHISLRPELLQNVPDDEIPQRVLLEMGTPQSLS